MTPRLRPPEFPDFTVEAISNRCIERHRRLRAIWRATKQGRYRDREDAA